MPFDGMDFRPRPEHPFRAARTEKAWAVVVVIVTIVMLVAPLSAEGVVDIVRFIRGDQGVHAPLTAVR
jgi:hypothetical protein